MTLWILGLFTFALTWTIGGTITGDSRKKFDVFFRDVIRGGYGDWPVPKSCLLIKDKVTTTVLLSLC